MSQASQSSTDLKTENIHNKQDLPLYILWVFTDNVASSRERFVELLNCQELSLKISENAEILSRVRWEY